MTAQFTPGPWKVSHDEYAGHYDVSTFDPERGSEAIAQVLYANNEPGGRGEADARLIAAAPALLEALQTEARAAELSAAIMRNQNRTGGWSGAEKTAQAFDRIAKNLRAAISLARGESK